MSNTATDDAKTVNATHINISSSFIRVESLSGKIYLPNFKRMNSTIIIMKNIAI